MPPTLVDVEVGSSKITQDDNSNWGEGKPTPNPLLNKVDRGDRAPLQREVPANLGKELNQGAPFPLLSTAVLN